MNPERRTCATCGHAFMADAAWKRQCLPCWKASRGPQKAAKGGGAAWDMVGALEARVRALRADLEAAAIPADVVRLLLQLCHPDRHGQSPASVRATQWLLERRKAGR